MEPGVPFALLGAVVLLAVAAWTGLAATALVRSGLRRSRVAPALLVAAGGLVLAAVETVTAVDFGDGSSDLLPPARTAGLLLVAAGLYAGALARRRPASVAGSGDSSGGSRRRPPAAAPLAVAAPLAAVVVPLAASPAPSLLAAAAGVAAALCALRSRRDGPGVLLALGLLLAAAAAGAAPLADRDGGALAVLALRGTAAAALLAALVVLARSSVLGKVVAAILAGVLVMATAAVGVVGSVVASAAEREQASLVSDAAQGRRDLVRRALEAAQAFTTIAARGCTVEPASCDQVLEQLTPPTTSNFALLVPAQGTPQLLGGRAPLDAAEALGLAGSVAVRRALEGGAQRLTSRDLPTTVRLVGPRTGLANIVVVPLERPTPTAPAEAAFVYGERLDDEYLGLDPDTGGFGVTLLVGDQVVASNGTERERRRIAEIARESGAASGVAEDGRTVAAEGSSPTVHFLPVRDFTDQPVGTLALSRTAELALGSQRDALQALLLTALAATAVVGALAFVLGRRTVDPLRRLTSAASQVAAGDLTVRTGLRSRDEVGTLSRTFDAMTGSVAQLTGDLRASASRLETVLSSMTDGLVATDADGRVTSINPAALAMAGLQDPRGALGYRLADVIDVRVAGEPLALDVRAPDVEAEVHPLDGDPVPVRAALAPLDDGEGVVLVLRDTTREREVERMKTEFLSNVSHELRTPLTPIRGYADILVARPGLPAEKVTAFAGTILAESLKMNRVVDLLVDVAAIEAGRVTVTPRAVPPAELIDGRLDAWRGRAPERAGDLKRRVAGRLPAVHVDPDWLAKALDELIDNAVKYTKPGTPITLSAALAPDGDRVRVAVRDAGPGIAAADQKTLFTSFEQVDGSATRRVGGLGLGLSFVRRLAEDAGFPLSFSSTLGKGTEFAVDLPISDEVPPPRRRRALASRR